MAENHYNRATFRDLTRVQLQTSRSGHVTQGEIDKAVEAALPAVAAQLDVEPVLSRSDVRNILWKHLGGAAAKPESPALPKVRTA